VSERLNAHLADELTAVNQYMVHAEMCDNWGTSDFTKRFSMEALSRGTRIAMK